MLASALESQPVATVSGESWVFLWSLYLSYRLAGCASTMGRIFARFGAKLEMSAWVAAAWQGLDGHEAKNHKNSLGDL
ncbi:hypothetical protein ACLB1Q_03970 [Escherichia coli]